MTETALARHALVFLVLAFALGAWACGGSEHSSDGAELSAADQAKMASVLATCDAQDGTEASRRRELCELPLGMPGKAEHPVKVGDYTLHCCSSGCQERVAKEPEQFVLAMELPKP